jgi:hypothetical protein
LARLPQNPIFELAFKLHYAYKTYMMGERDLDDFIRLGLHAGGFFGKHGAFGKEPRQQLRARACEETKTGKTLVSGGESELSR